MKDKYKICLIGCLLLIISTHAWTQNIVDTGNDREGFIGTWVYQSNDTIFKVVFQKGEKIFQSFISYGLYGGYYLSVKGEVLEDYMNPLPICWNLKISRDKPKDLHIWVRDSDPADKLPIPTLSFTFYDQRKKHFDGEGISGGYIKLLSPKQILWHLDEKAGRWWKLEGRDDIDMKDVPFLGFSVPEHVIMAKEETFHPHDR
ncbi:DUF6705 family protein [uncultured Bacteroides sp.]|uniref:DUF6705 family protein n=1 Tax=uncultured Bacteroides sp. TaxID=162156 RepID=UPI002620ED30|nr:DUF6705 family protein [uncultured Bacteroides sp.]